MRAVFPCVFAPLSALLLLNGVFFSTSAVAAQEQFNPNLSSNLSQSVDNVEPGLQKNLTTKPKLPAVVSINLCSDQLVIALADPEQILSLSNLSHDSAGSFYADKAQDYPINKGLAEEVLALQPDLIIAGQYTERYTLQHLSGKDLVLQQLPVANSVATVLNNIQLVADWLGHSQRGLELVTQLQTRLDAIKPSKAQKRRAAIYDPNGYTVGRESLRGDVLERAGWVNVAAEKNITSYGVLPLETLVRLKPDMLLESPYSPGTYSRAQVLNEHPVLKSARMSLKVIQVPSAQTICGGPWTIDLIEQLSQD